MEMNEYELISIIELVLFHTNMEIYDITFIDIIFI